ncbi:MAG: tol-pal system protein YbgF [candidate division KSB1 bacterium]|nr:tol-pal system protein YbgF [candidate division KSB1 bacterium]
MRYFPFFLIFSSLIFFLSCAGTRVDNQSDEQAGTWEGEQDFQPDPDEEAEVLRLLGITEDEAKATASDDSVDDFWATETEAPDRNVGETVDAPEGESLEQEVERLEQQVNQKDEKLAELRRELYEKELEVQKKQQKVQESKQQAPQSTSITGSGSDALDSFRSRYDQALNLYKQRQYEQAIALFRELLAVRPQNTLTDNCQYWMGECYYGLTEYEKAAMEFNKVFMYPESNKLDDAQLKLGLCYINMGDNAQARTEFQKLINEYPNSEYIPRAQSYLSRLQ